METEAQRILHGRGKRERDLSYLQMVSMSKDTFPEGQRKQFPSNDVA